MITICEGWRRSHTPIILSETATGPSEPSHGICPACYRDIMNELDLYEAPTMPKYVLIWTSLSHPQGFYYTGNRHWSDKLDEAMRFSSKSDLHMEATLQLGLSAAEYRVEEVTT